MGRLDELRLVDEVLTGIAQGYGFPGMVGTKLFPVKKASKEKVRIPQFGKEAFTLYSTLKAPRAKVQRMEWAASYLTASLERHMLEVAIDEEEYAEFGDRNLLRINRTKTLLNSIALKVEYKIAQEVLNVSKYPAENTKTLAGTSQWNDYDNSNPIDDIEDAKEAVRQSAGIRPNVMVVSAAAYKKLKEHPKILEKIKYSQKGIATPALIAEIFDLQEVYIGEAVYVDKNGNFVDVWGKDVVLGIVPDAVRQSEDYSMPAFGYTVRKMDKPTVYTYAEPGTTSEVIQVEDYISAWMTGPYAGYLIKNAVA